MLPNSEYTPAGLLQLAFDRHCPFSVGRNFAPPERPVAFRLAVTARAAVPKTAVNKDGKPEFLKNKIRLSNESIVSSPAGDVGMFQQPNETKFSGSVSVRPNSGHQRRSSLLGKKIHCEFLNFSFRERRKVSVNFYVIGLVLIGNRNSDRCRICAGQTTVQLPHFMKC